MRVVTGGTRGCCFKGTFVSVIHQMCREVYIRALLLAFHDFGKLDPARGTPYERQLHRMGGEVSKMNLNAFECAKCPEVNLLANTLIRVMREGLHFGCEVPNQLKFISWEHSSKERVEIEPFMGRVLQCPVVQIEPVNIRVGLQGHSQKCRNRLSAVSRPAPQQRGWYVINIVVSPFAVNTDLDIRMIIAEILHSIYTNGNPQKCH